MGADIPVIGTPTWLGEDKSVSRRAIEQLYGGLRRIVQVLMHMARMLRVAGGIHAYGNQHIPWGRMPFRSPKPGLSIETG